MQMTDLKNKMIFTLVSLLQAQHLCRPHTLYLIFSLFVYNICVVFCETNVIIHFYISNFQPLSTHQNNSHLHTSYGNGRVKLPQNKWVIMCIHGYDVTTLLTLKQAVIAAYSQPQGLKNEQYALNLCQYTEKIPTIELFNI